MTNSISTDITVLEDACEALAQQGWAARLLRHWLRDEVDVRLHVCGPQPWLEVEVLGPYQPYDAMPVADRWAAVRVDAGDRVVWLGPQRCCASGELLQFTLALLQASVAELEVSYCRLS